MTTEEKYMRRCLQLAENGRGYVSPNPMVGAVIVHNNKIIGEGFHREYGKPHAEVNAINSVKDKSLLRESVIYVSLEPCSHYGKTPPCSQLIIDSGIPKVVVATTDPYPEVSGRGIRMLQNAGIEVITGVLEHEARLLNKEFISAQVKKRPYIYLKWAQTEDGFIDKLRTENSLHTPTPISNEFTRMLVHKLRSEVAAIMIGTNTAINDNPSLTTRYWYGKNPIRIVLDRLGRIPKDYKIFDNSIRTLIFTESLPDNQPSEINVTYVEIPFDKHLLPTLLSKLNELKIDSLLVEGGSLLLNSFINAQLWDEAFIEIADKQFGSGVPAPELKGHVKNERIFKGSKQKHLIREINL
ncbi:bifunctional diaminohydroxyphosphoribosylaminopyrimidine deaminase/5-amino-6-(5-phosphoribosylamino)uracil reductase RibD [Dysgonomonas sp. 216]|uniref:bifunctional diaminohydroxyphosphoribosylaminopyrimidine deaminase/5-amino-6-(5-phosphoribosylamino)uracil reductase RibD n=1 Tax=Dysgonomonas sp. 216 TaxID=2302934 RepID=UPI0013D13977|nr:bifunctional diaminohydroxyphosphoribosylaminopyrimidine deaminase/5-amino-6-(5-phosphoribosylamino)uracil reductase RibD [Dysgonomonas sp. 216]NDW18286.1 bifunctional diaminohydroxyphosphoribosylaminopyrimidine deaminase/5-amino-6-(5-phosphoribosylamino)uracil reductase RibD [Dysgonomonas sp. 216]NDW18654.1 bifunctional diaminohydroxyphosphoribosylaminopyrimidine deaminase/5-amino-6-(5-phosphoribosylamino)uracil reductase RibD [Dysgonomonas sp. 216]